jgi:uncharacterized protein YjbI with pentapeptide repeats
MTTPAAGLDSLRADCSSCVGLCCVALPLTRSADFAIDKPAGTPCPHLTGADQCEIHALLPQRGFPGCAAFDCFGAGQQVTQVTFGGASWRGGEVKAEAMFRAFAVLRPVHEMRWYLADAAARVTDSTLRAEVEELERRFAQLSQESSAVLDDVDVAGLRREVGDVLRRVSQVVRTAESEGDGTVSHAADPHLAAHDLTGPHLSGRDFSGRDLIGHDLHGADLRRALLRGALLLGVNLRRADLRGADLLGADLRAADVSGADLRDALFLTQPQVAAAVGDGATRIPWALRRPAHWS